MKFALFVFSDSGNTVKIANKYKSILEDDGAEVITHMITLPLNEVDITPYDFIGIFYPIHAFNAPKIVLDFAKILPVSNKKLFIVKTSGEPLILNNASSLKLLSILKKKGYNFTNEYSYCMPYNMIFRHDDGFATKMNSTALKLIEVDALELVKSIPHYLKKCPMGGVISFVFRIEHPAMKVNGKLFRVNKNKCVNCMQCINNCPTKNISFENGKFHFKNNCTMCTACSFNCPTNAISIGVLNSWKVNGRYSLTSEECFQQTTHKNYCKKAYIRYFDEADKRIKNSI